MNAANIGTISTVLTALFALSAIGLAVWVSLSTAGRPRFFALIGIGSVLLGRFLGVLAPMIDRGYTGLGLSMIIQGVLTLVGMGLLSWALVEALRDWSAGTDGITFVDAAESHDLRDDLRGMLHMPTPAAHGSSRHTSD